MRVVGLWGLGSHCRGFRERDNLPQVASVAPNDPPQAVHVREVLVVGEHFHDLSAPVPLFGVVVAEVLEPNAGAHMESMEVPGTWAYLGASRRLVWQIVDGGPPSSLAMCVAKELNRRASIQLIMIIRSSGNSLRTLSHPARLP